MRLTLVRHPEVAWPAGVCYGQLDVGLAEPMTPPPSDVLQALRALGPVDAVWASPLRRASTLAQALADELGLGLDTDARWMEMHFGAWEGCAWSGISREASERWLADLEHQAPPGGETLGAMRDRVHAAMDALAAGDAAHVVVVTHAGPIRVALARARGQGPTQALTHPVPFGGLITLHTTTDHPGAPMRWREA